MKHYKKRLRSLNSVYISMFLEVLFRVCSVG
nr:MAG TPA: hypothetical protein [Caudoviricetes sp.]